MPRQLASTVGRWRFYAALVRIDALRDWECVNVLTLGALAVLWVRDPWALAIESAITASAVLCFATLRVKQRLDRLDKL